LILANIFENISFTKNRKRLSVFLILKLCLLTNLN
jgi:hypothetical protein